MFVELNQILLQILADKGDRKPVFVPVFELQPAQIFGCCDAIFEAWRKAGEGSLDVNSSISPTSARAVLPGLSLVTQGTDPGSPIEIQKALRGLLEARDPRLLGAAEPFNVHQGAETLLQGLLTSRELVTVPWPHMMYGYLIENTRIWEIIKRVVWLALHDEVLGTLSDTTYRVVNQLEAVFFRDGPSSLITSMTSWVRPDIGATRRCAYHRMFGIDLNHGAANGGSYAYPRARIANTDFMRTLQSLLSELWRGVINARNQSGPNSTDIAAIAELVTKLKTMMTERRLSEAGRANLAREEFVITTTMAFFHLLVLADNALIDDLRAHADQPEDRLRKLGSKVQIEAHPKSRCFFSLAGTLPPFLREIEEGIWDDLQRIPLLFDPQPTGSVHNRTVQIILQLSLATGVDLKSVPVAAASR